MTDVGNVCPARLRGGSRDGVIWVSGDPSVVIPDDPAEGAGAENGGPLQILQGAGDDFRSRGRTNQAGIEKGAQGRRSESVTGSKKKFTT